MNNQKAGIFEFTYFKKLARDFLKNKVIYFMALPVVLYFVVFKYLPMYGAVIAFKDFRGGLGIMGSPWAGLKHFQSFFSSIYCWRLIRNTLLINLYNLIWGFPAPIILALLLNELRSEKFKRLIQTISYMPHFISVVVISGLIVDFFSTQGLLSGVFRAFGADAGNYLAMPQYFRSIYVGSNIWTGLGWGTIIYLAALSNIDQELYGAATIDGAGRWGRVIHVTIPGIFPTIVILLILNFGQMMNLGWEKIILLYSPATYETADVISSYTYRRGMLEADYSFGAAVGLFNSVVNFCLIILANTISKKLNDTAIW